MLAHMVMVCLRIVLQTVGKGLLLVVHTTNARTTATGGGVLAPVTEVGIVVVVAVAVLGEFGRDGDVVPDTVRVVLEFTVAEAVMKLVLLGLFPFGRIPGVMIRALGLR